MYTARGIILKREDFRERDERVFLYTKEFGKMSVVAKGTKRIEAKLRGNLDIFNFVDIIFVEGNNFFILTGIDTRERFQDIVKDPYIYGAAVSCARSIADIFEENQRDRNLFNFFRKTLKKLHECAQAEDPGLHAWLIQKKFQMTILENQGYSMNAEKILPDYTKKFSKNSLILLEMLRGAKYSSVRLSRRELWDIEKAFTDIFEYIFRYRFSSWIPII